MSQEEAQKAYENEPFRGPGLDDIAIKADEILHKAIELCKKQVNEIETETDRASEYRKIVQGLNEAISEYNGKRASFIDRLKEIYKTQKDIDETNAGIKFLQTQINDYERMLKQRSTENDELDKRYDQLNKVKQEKIQEQKTAMQSLEAVKKDRAANDNATNILKSATNFYQLEKETSQKIIELLKARNTDVPISNDRSDVYVVANLVKLAEEIKGENHF